MKLEIWNSAWKGDIHNSIRNTSIHETFNIH